MDWNNFEIRNGWTLGDFKYKGNSVVGFSEQGKEKVKNFKSLIIPSVVPDDKKEKYSELAPVVSIGEGAFANRGLKSVVIPNTIKYIKGYAFANNNMFFVSFPNKLQTLGRRSFKNNSLTSVTIPEDVKNISDEAFANNCLSEVILPKNLTTIGKNSFQNNELTKVKIPTTVIRIKEFAFFNNVLVDITIPERVREIGSLAFGNNHIKNITFKNRLSQLVWEPFVECFEPNISLEHTKTDAEDLKELGRMFYFIKSLDMENALNLKSIPSMVFANHQLEKVGLPPNLEKIENNAFYDNNIKRIFFPYKLKIIGSRAFSNNKIENLFIPNSVEKIELMAFRNNPMKSLVLGKGLKEIGKGAFPDTKEVEEEIFKKANI